MLQGELEGFVRPGAILMSLALLLVVGGVGTQVSSASSPLGQPQCLNTILLSVSMSNQYLWNNTTLGPACMMANFTVTNAGNMAHTFTVSSLVNQTDPSSTDQSWFAAPNLLYDQTLNASSGGVPAVLRATIIFSKPGAYEFICRPHYALGMFGKIYAGEPLFGGAAPSPPRSTSPFWYLVLTISVLAILAVVGMVFGISRSRRTGGKSAPGRPAKGMKQQGQANLASNGTSASQEPHEEGESES